MALFEEAIVLSEKITEQTINENIVSPEKISEAIKNEYKNSTNTNSENEMEEKIYNLGFMPLNEVTGLVLNELGESYDLERVKNLWLPKSQKMNQIFNTQPQLIDENKLKDIIKDIDSTHSQKLQEIESKLQLNPFWKANAHSIKLVKIDELIALQSFVNLNRAHSLAKKIAKNATVEELLDFVFDFNRKPPQINHHSIANNAILFSTIDHDVRPGKIEVRKIERYAQNGSGDKISALVIPILEGDSSVYCINTHTSYQLPDGTNKMAYFLTLQNGIHRAYALRSLGIEYMPCLIIEPKTSNETNMLMGNWPPERLQQNGSQRPPLMKDFFNQELTETFKMRKRLLCVRVEWKVEKFTT